MKKLITITFLSLLLFRCNYSKKEFILLKIKNLAGKVHYNTVEKIIDISDIQIPLQQVEMTYYNDIDSTYIDKKGKVYNNCVLISCTSSNDSCIFNNTKNTYLTEILIPLESKGNCYSFIEAVGDLKDLK